MDIGKLLIPEPPRQCLPTLAVEVGVDAAMILQQIHYLLLDPTNGKEINGNPASTFFVKTKGDSMKDAGITSGDILIVDRSVTPKDKQIVVAMLDGEFTVKRLRRKKGQVFLVAENNAFAPMEITDDQELIIWGVVTFVIHQPR